ncbi:hypothetical protein C8T65DRAFT_686415 [Cerioporus squamosus]|nr:hypothetical protein C8T65DRAFT_686415 [Cerioporus squamosus]
MATSTRSIRAYRFPHWGEAHSFHITVRHHDIGDGLDIPLFENVFTTIDHVNEHIFTTEHGQVTYHIYYTTRASTGDPNESLLVLPNGPSFRGELLVLRRASHHHRFVNLRPGDIARAKQGVFE